MPISALPRCALSMALSLAAVGACAQSTAPASAAPEAPTATWGAGLLLSAEVSPYRGVGSELRVLPALQFDNPWVRVFGPVIDLKLHDAESSNLALRLRYADTGYKARDSAFLAGMGERKNSVWLGAKGEWRNGIGQLSGEWLADASGHSKGQQLKVVAETLKHLGPVGIVPRLGLVWQDRKHVDYHFGVNASEARTGRDAYAGKAAVSTEIGVRLLHRLAPQQSVFLDLSATALGSAIQDSPLVDRRWVSAARLGYVYRF
ncbi:MipA/OmpV family protein [Hydrogenophaga sp. SL48]|uniref:MipA/OmpV family protein n=1 Tax=Hydrogenophaga sp. SL48 TaxID=2806347 RepID=UPI001F4892D6|nr:MipA/OmpV family protein [Hydrogenophaga sp. SL48]UJW80717.1 MipA/OmpV family protein [Hydrogenophaga sp. SL48]